jgi:hypothetical protein
METIVDSLFSVFVTLGTVPIIRCPRGNAAEMVAEKLDKKLRENLRDARNSFFTTDNIQAGHSLHYQFHVRIFDISFVYIIIREFFIKIFQSEHIFF